MVSIHQFIYSLMCLDSGRKLECLQRTPNVHRVTYQGVSAMYILMELWNKMKTNVRLVATIKGVVVVVEL